MSWYAPTSLAAAVLAQNRLLKYYLRSSYEVKYAHSLNYIVVKGSKENSNRNNKKERVLVLMHGYGLGLGFFYENYDALAPHFDRIVAVDWPGMGCSSRHNSSLIPSRLSMAATSCSWLLLQNIGKAVTGVAQRISAGAIIDESNGSGAGLLNIGSFAAHSHEEANKLAASYVTNTFIDKLEQLRKEEGIESFVLAGHSLGGFLSAKYAIKYPEAVDNLILISPVGVPAAPAAEERAPVNQLDWRVRVLSTLWRMNVTPQAVVRLLGSRGPQMMTDVVTRRFSRRWAGEELQLISDYLYHISAAPGSGEYALSALLEPVFTTSSSSSSRSDKYSSDISSEDSKQKSKSSDAAGTTAARSDNSSSSNSVKRSSSGVYAFQPVEQELCALRVPLLLVYGDNDWLHYPTAERSVQLWRRSGVPKAQLAIVPSAGHHLYLDNSEHFNKLIVDWIGKS